MKKNRFSLIGFILALFFTLVASPCHASQDLDLHKIAIKGKISGIYECALTGKNEDLRIYLHTHLGTVDDLDPISGYRLIDCAILGNQYHTVKVLKEEFLARIDQPDRFGAYPIHFAAMRDNTDILKFLIKQGADVNTRTKATSGTPLYYAAAFGCVHSVKVLLEKGANPNIPAEHADQKGDLPLEIAQKVYCIIVQQDPQIRYEKLKEMSFPILAEKDPKELSKKLRETIKILESHSSAPGTTLVAPQGAFSFHNHRQFSALGL